MAPKRPTKWCKAGSTVPVTAKTSWTRGSPRWASPMRRVELRSAVCTGFNCWPIRKPKSLSSDLLETISPYLRQQVAVAGQRRRESLGVLGRLVPLFSRQGSVTVVQQPRCRVSLKSHPVEDVLVARRREDFFTMREVFMPWAMVPPVLQVFVQAVRNRFARSIVDPKSRVGPSTEHVVQLEEIDDALPAMAKRVVEQPRCLWHAMVATRQQVCDRLRRQLDHDDGRCLEGLEETGGKSHRDAVASPELSAIPRIDVDFSKAQIPRQIASRAEVVLQFLE